MGIETAIIVALPIVLNFIWNIVKTRKDRGLNEKQKWVRIFKDAFDATEQAFNAGVLKGDKWETAWRLIRQLAVVQDLKVGDDIEKWAKSESMVYAMQKKTVVNGLPQKVK